MCTPLKDKNEWKSTIKITILGPSRMKGKTVHVGESDDKENITQGRSKSNKSIKRCNKKGQTPLHIACSLGLLDKVTEYLNAGANPNTKNDVGWTPLHEAVRNKRLDIVQKLLQHNALINVPGLNNETPLHEAVKCEFGDIIKELIINGADLNARNYKGATPLDLASEHIKKIIKEAEENVIQTETVNVANVLKIQSETEFDDIYVYSITECRVITHTLNVLAKLHSNFHIETVLTAKITHLIVDIHDGVCMTTLDVLRAIAFRAWIISSAWVREGNFANMRDYEVRGVGTMQFNGPRNARYSKYKLLPGLLNGCHIYLHDFNSNHKMYNTININKAILSKLIIDLGGIVLRHAPNPESIPEEQKIVPYHARKGSKLEICSHYIIYRNKYEPKYNMKHIKALPFRWLLECIEKYELCDP